MSVLHRCLQLLQSDGSSAAMPILFALVLVSQGVFAQVSSIDIVVPQKDGLGEFQIAYMELTVQVDTTAAIGFTMTPPVGAADSTPNMTPGNRSTPADTMLFGSDLVRFYPPDASLDANDPRRRNYRITISPHSDFDPNSCVTQMTGDETWTLAVTGGAIRIVNACLISEDENTSLNACNGNYRVVPSNEAFAEIGGLTSQEQSCRFGVEAMLVLDRSGSMSGRARPAEPVSVTNQKIVSLRDAVTTFMTALTDVRAIEAANGLTVPTDQMGVVIFNSDAEALPGVPTGLNNFDATLPGMIDTELDNVTATGSTSIGDGLILAAGALGGAGPDVRRVILLMSDGRQNTDRRVSVIGDEIVTHSGATACPSGSASAGCDLLPSAGNYSICSVTVGTSTAVEPQINQDVALAGDCFYLNSEDDASEMSTFFLNVLQNFLATSSWQTLLAGSDTAAKGTPSTVTVPVTTTTLGLSVVLVPQGGEFVCLRVAAPGQPPGEQLCGSDGVSFRQAASQMVARDMGGDWQLLIEAPRSPSERPAGFYLIVLADDVGTHASAEVVAQEFAPGKPIRVRVRLDEHGAPLTGLPGTGLNLRLARPSLTLGEFMAGVTPDTSGADDPDASDADAAVENAVANDPSILLDEETVIPLAEGDPGVYEAQFSIEKYGHADLVLTLRGASPRGGTFIRQIGKTIYIKAVPDETETEVTTQVIQGAEVNRLAIQLTPKTIGGFPVGPGWKNYYWLRGLGVAPFKLEDDLNGTYSGTITFSGAEPPMLSVHFIPDSVSISDEVPASELPSALDDTTVLIPEVGTGEPPIPWWLKILIVLLVVLLIVFVVVYIIRRRAGV